MKECAFCPHTAKLSAEHIVSDWINDLFPGKKKFSLKTAQGVDTEWTSNSLDWRAKVVCETCNNTWMSEIENNHAKPALTDLIIGNTDIAFTESRARSITFSAFKTGVILDHSQRDRQPFFSRRIRYAFRDTSTYQLTLMFGRARTFQDPAETFIPATKQERCHLKIILLPPIRLSFMCLRGLLDIFCFQFVAVKQIVAVPFAPNLRFDNLAVPIWPRLHTGYLWPERVALRNKQQFEVFAERWRKIDILGKLYAPSRRCDSGVIGLTSVNYCPLRY